MHFYVSNTGNDTWEGSLQRPVSSLERAKELVRKYNKNNQENVTVKIAEGKYYLKAPLVFSPEDGGKEGRTVTYEGVGRVTISGAVRINPNWELYKGNIYKTEVPAGTDFDCLFINGSIRHMARYPAYNEKAEQFNGYAMDSFDRGLVKNYQSPEGGFMHVMHEALWGDFHYCITGMTSSGILEYKGGWQNNRSSAMHHEIRYIENIFEELDCKEEWFLNKKESTLYYIPASMDELQDTLVEGARLKNLITLKGEEGSPVKNICFKNLCFTHSKRTFMEKMEPVFRSDWCIYRGGAVLLDGTENILLSGCEIKDAGGNAITVSGYNRNTTVQGCMIENAGASSVVFIGDFKAVRSPLFGYESIYGEESKVDWGAGPQNENYPSGCMVEDCLLIRNGRVEKQSAGISLSVCTNIKIKNNTIYEVPRAGINICDGTWGGHEITDNIVFDTVLETSDHGAFNSWGRDRYWDCRYEVMQNRLEKEPDLPLLDAMETTVIKHNIFECANGWDIDLDDGSSNYLITDNLCLTGGIKNREGIRRRVQNNILLNNTFHPHVWFKNSMDEFTGNIIFRPYADISLHGWGAEFDRNILYSDKEERTARELQEKTKMDKHSMVMKVEFMDINSGDFRFKNSCLQELLHITPLNFQNCGVVSGKLKKQAKSPFDLPCKIERSVDTEEGLCEIEGMKIKRLSGIEEISATGMYQETGIYVKEISEDSSWFEKGVRANDVLLYIDEKELKQVGQVLAALEDTYREITIWREQKKWKIELPSCVTR